MSWEPGPRPATVGAVRRTTTWLGPARVLGLLWALGGCTGRPLYDDPSRTYADAGAGDRPQGRVVVHAPASLRGLAGPLRNPQGQPADVTCATCHAVLSPPPRLPDTAQELGGPHAGLRFDHGSNTCRSCHDPGAWDRLRLASGETLPMTEAMRLCAQCHGPQHTNYLRGSHGGMSGHWDLSRGDRLRNHCVDCHDPHVPRFPRYQPMPPPRDTAPRGHDHE